MGKRSGYLILAILLFIVTIISCHSNNSKIALPPPIPPEDSALIANIEADITFGRTDSGLLKIQSIEHNNVKKGHDLFHLKLLNLKARLLAKNKEYDKALSTCDQIISISEENLEQLRIPYVYANLVKGDIYFELRNYRTAYKFYFEARNNIEGYQATCEYAQYDYRVAVILYKQNKYREAILNFKKAYKNYYECQYDFSRYFRMQEIQNDIGFSFYNIGEYDSALVYYSNALKKVNSIKPKNTSQVKYISIANGVIEGNMGKAFLKLGKIDTAFKLLYHNIEINSKPKYDNNDAITSIVALANYYFNQKDYKAFNKVISIVDTIPNIWKYKDQMKYVYELKSNYFYSQHKYKEALFYKNMFESIKDSLTLIQLNNINSDFQLSIETFEKENKLNDLIDASQKRTFYNYLIIAISIGLLIYIITISSFLKYSNNKNKSLKVFNNEIHRQKYLLNKANEEINKNIDILKTRDAEKNKILSIVAHDLRNPNYSISSLAELLLEDKNLSKEQIEIIEMIKVSANSNNDLIEEIMFFAKPGQFSKNSDYNIINCKTLIEQTISLNKLTAIKKNINIVTQDIPSDINLKIDVNKIRRAITNVIVNAIKFSNHYTTITIFTTQTDKYINIHVKDQGIGIPDKIKNGIFVSDSIIRRIGTDGEPSFGIGLSIVRQYIQDHNGKITFTSDENGTDFIISLPIYEQIN